MARIDASEHLALLAVAGELVIAVQAHEVFQIRRAAETSSRRIEANLYSIDLDDETIPGWDLGELFKLGACKDAWIIVEPVADRRLRRFGLRVGRCIAVHRLPKCVPVPPTVMTDRAHAITSAFATAMLPAVSGWPSGVVLDLGRLLSATEVEAGARLFSRRAGALA